MKILNRWAGLVLSAVLIFGGCTVTPAPDSSGTPPKASSTPADSIPLTPKGRYVETEITPPPQSPEATMVAPLAVFPHADGSVDYFVEERTPNGKSPADGQTENLYHYRSTDGGGAWELQTTAWLPKVAELCGVSEKLTDPPKPETLTNRAIVRWMDMDGVGSLYCALRGSDDKLRLAKVTPDYSISEISIADWQNAEPDSGLTPRDFRVTESGNIGVSYLPRSAGTALYDGKTGEPLIDVYEAAGDAWAFTDDTVILSEGGKLAAFKESGKLDGSCQLPHYGRGMAMTAADGALFVASHSGVDSLGDGAALVETIMEGSLYQFSDPNCEIEQLRYEPQTDSFFMILRRSGGTKLYRYHFDPDMPVKPGTRLDVFSLNDSGSVRSAIIDFQMKNPSVAVSYSGGFTGDSEVTGQDAARTLELELHEGGGPDVLILDGLEVERYATNGWLADFTAYCEALSAGDYEKN